MPRYAAFLRGVMPTNARMPELKKCFEAAGFTGVRTILSSGNVVFSARSTSPGSLERKAEACMEKRLGRAFPALVRPLDVLQELLEADPFAAFRLPANAKRVVTFLREPPRSKITLPVEMEGARILCLKGGEAFSAYVPGPRSPVFMTLIERTFGSAVTTRTWDTVRRVAAAADGG